METSKPLREKPILSLKALEELIDVLRKQHDEIQSLTAAYELELERRKTADGVADILRAHIRRLEDQIAAAQPRPERVMAPPLPSPVTVMDQDEEPF